MNDYGTVTAWMISADTAAQIGYVRDVFGATERGDRMLTPDGSIAHAELDLGDSVIMLFDNPGGSTIPSHLRVFVDDLAGTVRRAVHLGARVVTEPSELFWGDRVARFRDPQGHLWWVFERPASPLGEEEVAARLSEPEFQAAMRNVQQSLADELRSTG